MTDAIKALPLPKDGAAGKDGASISSGVGAPTFEAKSGDLYLDATTGDLYEWR